MSCSRKAIYAGILLIRGTLTPVFFLSNRLARQWPDRCFTQQTVLSLLDMMMSTVMHDMLVLSPYADPIRQFLELVCHRCCFLFVFSHSIEDLELLLLFDAKYAGALFVCTIQAGMSACVYFLPGRASQD